MAKHCTSVTKCGFCAAVGHRSSDCPKQGEAKAHKCVNCKGNPNHTAWARECPVRKARVAIARLAYTNRPTRFQVHRQGQENSLAPATPVFPIQTTFTPASSIPSFGGSQQEGSESEQEAPAPKRRRGRPTTKEILQRRTPGAQDIREALFSTQNE